MRSESRSGVVWLQHQNRKKNNKGKRTMKESCPCRNSNASQDIFSSGGKEETIKEEIFQSATAKTKLG